MSIKFQYNKVEQLQLQKQLGVRQKALPTLQSKEAALRVEVKKAKTEAEELQQQLLQEIEAQQGNLKLWGEYTDDLLTVKDVRFEVKKVAGAPIPLLQEVLFDIKPYSMFDAPAWFPRGVYILKQFVQRAIEQVFLEKKTEILDAARKKTTQKVNLYEKVQIPGFEEAIRKIKRFLEDEENLSKSAQKIVKMKQERLKESA